MIFNSLPLIIAPKLASSLYDNHPNAPYRGTNMHLQSTLIYLFKPIRAPSFSAPT